MAGKKPIQSSTRYDIVWSSKQSLDFSLGLFSLVWEIWHGRSMGEFIVRKKGPSVLALALGCELAGVSKNVGSFLSLGHPSICCISESILTHLRWYLVGHPCWLVSLSVDPLMSLVFLWPLGRSFTWGLWLLMALQTLSSWPYCLAYCFPALCALLIPFCRPHHKCGKNLPVTVFSSADLAPTISLREN